MDRKRERGMYMGSGRNCRSCGWELGLEDQTCSYCGVDWERRAKMYLVDDWMTRGAVMEILKNEGFSHDQALKGTEFLK